MSEVTYKTPPAPGMKYTRVQVPKQDPNAPPKRELTPRDLQRIEWGVPPHLAAAARSMGRIVPALILAALCVLPAHGMDFSSGGYIARNADTKQYLALSPYWNNLRSQVAASSLSDAAKSNAQSLISSAGSTPLPGAGGTFSGAGCSVTVSCWASSDYLVPAGYVEGSAYSVSLHMSVTDVHLCGWRLRTVLVTEGPRGRSGGLFRATLGRSRATTIFQTTPFCGSDFLAAALR